MRIQANVGDLGVSVRRPWQMESPTVDATKEEGITHDRASHHIGVVSELWPCTPYCSRLLAAKCSRCTVAYCEDVAICSLHLRVIIDAIVFIKVNSGLLKTHTGDIRLSARCEQDCIDVELFLHFIVILTYVKAHLGKYVLGWVTFL